MLEKKRSVEAFVWKKKKWRLQYKYVNKNFSYLIRSYNAIESDWLQGVNTNRLGGGVNIILIKCALFLQKGLNVEKIVISYNIASLIYALYAQANRLTIWVNNLYLHATHHAPSIVFLGVDWIKFI